MRLNGADRDTRRVPARTARGAGAAMIARSLVPWVAGLALVWAAPASAYIGPGAGLTVIGTALAFIAAIVLVVFGFVWYPVKRFIRLIRRKLRGTPE